MRIRLLLLLTMLLLKSNDLIINFKPKGFFKQKNIDCPMDGVATPAESRSSASRGMGVPEKNS